MKTLLALFCIIVNYQTVLAQNNGWPLKAKSAEGFTPAGWKLLTKASGDLNNDGKPDLALIIEKTDRSNFIANNNLGADTLNIGACSSFQHTDYGNHYKHQFFRRRTTSPKDKQKKN